MKVITAHELASKKYDSLKLDRYKDLVGEIEPGFVMQLWGRGGSGKSTFAIDFANELASHGKVVYVSAEESFGKTISDRIKRMNATHSRLMVAAWDEEGQWTSLKDFITTHKIDFVIIDSLSVVDPNTKKAEEFRKWAKERQTGLIFITHATKTGQYKGSTMVQHGVDIEIEAYDGMLRVNKTRYGLVAEDYPIQFERKGFKPLSTSSTSMKKSPQKSSSKRTNPVPVPFATTLKEVAKRHKIRGQAKLNKILNDRTTLLFRKNRSTLTGKWGDFVRYMRRNKVSVLEFFHDGAILGRYEGKDFSNCLSKLVNDVNPEITIHDQAHAKIVLGAVEYRRQERSYEALKKGTSSKKPSKAKPKRRPKKKTQAKKKPPTKIFTDSIAKPMNAGRKSSQSKKTSAKASNKYAATDKKMNALEALLKKAIG